jgi:SAM-dependent methyltransferase
MGGWQKLEYLQRMSQPDVLRGYAVDAATLISKFEALRTSEVLAPVAALLPSRPCRVLEIGAGTGRDAAWLAARGHSVVAVEPVKELRDGGMALHPSDRIRWVDDRLPSLGRLREPSLYDLILVVAVWQHLPASQHRQAIETLARRLSSEGRLIISLRHGPGSLMRPCFPAEPDLIVRYAEDAALRVRMRRSAGSVQQKNRDAGVTWTWLCFERA